MNRIFFERMMTQQFNNNQIGMSLLSVLMAMAISGVVVMGVNQILKNTLDLERAFDAKATRDDLVSQYQKLMLKRDIAKAVEKNNPNLLSYLTNDGSTPLVTHGPLKIVNEKGITLLPAAGKYFKIDGSTANKDTYFWHIFAEWQGKQNSTYEFKIQVKRNPKVQSWGVALTDKVKTAMNTTELSCTTVIGQPVLGPQVAGQLWSANIGFETWTPGNHGSTSRPKDSQYTITRVTCPEGTRLSGIRAWGACGGNSLTAYSLENSNSIPTNLRTRTGECRHFMGNFADPNCSQWLPAHNNKKEEIWGAKCEATCCTFSQ